MNMIVVPTREKYNNMTNNVIKTTLIIFFRKRFSHQSLCGCINRQRNNAYRTKKPQKHIILCKNIKIWL